MFRSSGRKITQTQETHILNLLKHPMYLKLIKGTFWLSLGTIFARGMVLIGVMAVARILDKQTFGYFAFIQSSIVTAAVFAGLGLGSTVTRHIAQMKDNNIIGLNVLLTLTGRLAVGSALLFSLLIILSADYISVQLLQAPELTLLLSVGATSIFFNILFGYFNAALIGFEAMRQSALAQAYASVISTPVLIALTYYLGLQGSILGLISQGAVLFSFSFFFYIRQRRVWSLKSDSNFGHNEYRVLWTYSLPAFIFNLIVMPVHWICHAILLRSAGGSTEMAITGVAMQWYFALLFLPSIAARVIFPALSKLTNQVDQKETTNVLRFSFLSNAAITIPIAILLVIIAPWVMNLYGPMYIEDSPVLVMVVCAACIATLAMPFNLYMVASGQVWIATAINLVWACTYVLLSALWIDQGALGLAKSIFVAHITQLVLIASTVWWKIRK